MGDRPIVLSIPRRRVLTGLLLTVATLATLFLTTHLLKLQGYEGQMGFRRLFNMDGEGTLPAWFSSTLMLAASVLLAAIATERARTGDRFRWHWCVLALGLLYMSADEAASIHEMMNRAGHALPLRADGLLRAPWVVFGIAVAAAVAIAYRNFLRSLPPATRRGFVMAGACYLGGALGVEMLGAAVSDVQGLQSQPDGWGDRGDFTIGYALLVTAEEAMEMSGMILFVNALLGYIARRAGRISVEVRDGPAPRTVGA